ncbi:sirohydrochlorin chelatase [Brevibacillus marinus]|uniref:sirohydrochlorin chelatase n=1 Tax=Brevibacillus marinus TaxID=2496837 RepID=UPI000F8289B9|nr:sirohydrochlorin chelatase [Brevibacillus marinus]
MEAVLFVGHGSKDAQGNAEVRQFVASLAPELAVPIVETCFLEFEPPDVFCGLEACVARGASRITVIPIMLFSAGHAKLHIPAALDAFKRKYPAVPVSYGRPVGVHQQVVAMLEARLAEAESGWKRRAEELAVLIVGRGSSDPDANSDLGKMARLFWERSGVKWVETAFMGVTFPTFAEGLERCRKLGARHVVVLPYFLFTGVLIKRMAAELLQWQTAWPDVRVTLGNYFGFHPLLKEVLKERVREALAAEVKLNCDLCQYRLAAMAHAAHHHHDHAHGHGHDHYHSHDHDHHEHGHHHQHSRGHDHHEHGHHHQHSHGHDHHKHEHSDHRQVDHQAGHGSLHHGHSGGDQPHESALQHGAPRIAAAPTPGEGRLTKR